VCNIIGADALVFASKIVKWDITNNGSDAATIVKIYLDEWPDDQYNQNYYLDRIKLGGDTVWNGWQWPAPATIQDGDWSAGNRTISGSGAQKTLELFFRWTAIQDEALYSITVTFDNGCTVSFNP